MRIPARAERPTNVSSTAEAKRLGINLAAREAIWLRENRAALESSNVWVEANGLPLAKYRQFFKY